MTVPALGISAFFLCASPAPCLHGLVTLLVRRGLILRSWILIVSIECR